MPSTALYGNKAIAMGDRAMLTSLSQLHTTWFQQVLEMMRMMGGATEEENVDAVKVVLQFWTKLEDVAASIRKLQQDDFVPEVDEYVCGLTGVSYGGFNDSAFLRDTAAGEPGADLEHILIWLMKEHRDPEAPSRETNITSVVQGKRLVTPYLRDREICGRATMGKDLDNPIAISLAISGARP